MLQVLPDLYPGRCLNYRHDSYARALRCTQYEAQEHVCKFEPLPPPVAYSSGAWVSGGALIQGPPWVRPEDRA